METLIEALNDASPFVRDQAAMALGRIGDFGAIESLKQVYRKNSGGAGDALSGDIAKFAFRGIYFRLARESRMEILVNALEGGDAFARHLAARRLGQLGDWNANKALEKALNDEEEDVRRVAENSLRKIRTRPPFDHQEDIKVAEGYFEKGMDFMLRGLLKEALPDLGRAIEFHPNFAEAYEARALLKFRLERFEEAIADFDKAIPLNPDNAKLYAARGMAKALRGHSEGAISDCERALAIDPENGLALAASDEVRLLRDRWKKESS
jgi:tetratricopeptide (TPR) repeat protein